MAKILSIDLGTTYFKMSLFDRNGRLCDTCRFAPPTCHGEAVGRPGYVEDVCAKKESMFGRKRIPGRCSLVSHVSNRRFVGAIVKRLP